ncbi:Metallo-peptidase family M12-domain-containing protein [Balamuthia mandrillaris]
MTTKQTALLAVLFFACCATLAFGSADFADIVARSQSLPERRELLSTISFTIHHPEDQTSVQRRTVGDATFNSHHSMTLSFRALDRQFSASLHHNAELFADDALISEFEDDELVQSFPPRSNAYLGEALIDGKDKAMVSAVLVDEEQGIFHMSINNEESGESFVVEPTYLHPTLFKRSFDNELHDMLGNHMVVFKENLHDLNNMLHNVQQSARQQEEEEEQQANLSCGTPDDEDVAVDEEEEEDNQDFADASPTSSCPPRSSTYLQMGVATDNQYVRKAGGSSGARNTISYVFNTLQSKYYSAVRNKPVIKSLLIHSSASSLGFNTASCPSDVQSRLSPFCSWRTRQGDRSIGLWHLLSGCLPDRSGVAGRAYYGAICLYSTRGCGITGYMGGNARWVIPAHEIGHNFGARHSSNIMAASVNSRATAFPSVAVSQMCQYTFRVSARTACLTTSAPSGARLAEGQEGEAPEEQSSAASTPMLFW